MSKADVHLDKEDLKRPDPFLQTVGKSWSAIERNSVLVTSLLGALILAAIVYLAWDFVHGRNERSAAETLYSTESEYFKLKEGFERARFEAMAPTPPDAKDNQADAATAATGDLEKDFGKVVLGFEDVVQKHPSTAAGAQAAIWLAEIYIDYKQPAKAVEAIDKIVGHQSGATLLFGLTHMVRGSALAASGDCAKAVESWQKVADSPRNSFLHPEALLKSGVCYESMSQFDKASEMYRRVTENHSETSAGQSARTFLRALEMKPVNAPAAKAG